MRIFPTHNIKEFSVFKKLNSPAKVQDFLNHIPINFEYRSETLHSPLLAIQYHKAHCFEGALLAAAIFWYHGAPPLLLDLETTTDDESHVVALFKQNGHWGAVSKTNHAVLRFRDPIYKTIRELALSYFNEYFKDNGKKTLRRYSAPINLLRFGSDWLTSEKDLWYIDEALNNTPHFHLINKKMVNQLRLADPIEIKAGKLVEWKKRKE